MPRKELTTLTGQLKKALALSSASHRRRYGQILVEGIQAVRELLTYQPQSVRDVYVTEQVLDAHADIDAILQNEQLYTHVLPQDLSSRVAPSAQGLFAVANTEPSREIAEVLAATKLIVCCVQANDPGNAGTIIRVADAVGAGGVVLGTGSVSATSPKVIRSAAGSTFHIPVWELDVAEAISAARDAGFQILLADASGTVDLLDAESSGIDLARPTVWMVGNEAHGFTQEQIGLADALVRIPMWGSAESLNVAMATTICLYLSSAAHHK